jgi:hypothetical protein
VVVVVVMVIAAVVTCHQKLVLLNWGKLMHRKTLQWSILSPCGEVSWRICHTHTQEQGSEYIGTILHCWIKKCLCRVCVLCHEYAPVILWLLVPLGQMLGSYLRWRYDHFVSHSVKVILDMFVSHCIVKPLIVSLNKLQEMNRQLDGYIILPSCDSRLRFFSYFKYSLHEHCSICY